VPFVSGDEIRAIRYSAHDASVKPVKGPTL
jgi:hypothetical protein